MEERIEEKETSSVPKEGKIAVRKGEYKGSPFEKRAAWGYETGP